MDLPELKCDVCGQKAKGVGASRLGAISFAYCSDCLKEQAEPYGMMVFTVADIGLESCAEWFKLVIQGTLKRTNKTYEKFLIDLEEEKVRLEKEYEEMMSEIESD